MTYPSHQIEALVARAQDLRTEVLTRTITCHEEYEWFVETCREARQIERALIDQRMDITRPLDESKRKTMGLFKPPLTFVAEVQAHSKNEMLGWDRAQEAKRAAEEARQREIARKEQARLEARAAAAAKKGQEEKAEVLAEAAASMPVPIVPRADPRPAGSTVTVTWAAKVTDKMALIRAVGEGKAPAALLEINQMALNAQARALRAEMDYPGVEAVEQKGMRIRR